MSSSCHQTLGQQHKTIIITTIISLTTTNQTTTTISSNITIKIMPSSATSTKMNQILLSTNWSPTFDARLLLQSIWESFNAICEQ